MLEEAGLVTTRRRGREKLYFTTSSPSAPTELHGGWPMISSGPKTLLETGDSLTTPGSLLYSQPAA